MAKEIPEGMVGIGDIQFKKKTLITLLILAFGIVMFTAGIYTGIMMEYKIVEEQVTWYNDYCVCSFYKPSQPSFNINYSLEP